MECLWLNLIPRVGDHLVFIFCCKLFNVYWILVTESIDLVLQMQYLWRYLLLKFYKLSMPAISEDERLTTSNSLLL